MNCTGFEFLYSGYDSTVWCKQSTLNEGYQSSMMYEGTDIRGSVTYWIYQINSWITSFINDVFNWAIFYQASILFRSEDKSNRIQCTWIELQTLLSLHLSWYKSCQKNNRWIHQSFRPFRQIPDSHYEALIASYYETVSLEQFKLNIAATNIAL